MTYDEFQALRNADPGGVVYMKGVGSQAAAIQTAPAPQSVAYMRSPEELKAALGRRPEPRDCVQIMEMYRMAMAGSLESGKTYHVQFGDGSIKDYTYDKVTGGRWSDEPIAPTPEPKVLKNSTVRLRDGFRELDAEERATLAAIRSGQINTVTTSGSGAIGPTPTNTVTIPDAQPMTGLWEAVRAADRAIAEKQNAAFRKLLDNTECAGTVNITAQGGYTMTLGALSDAIEGEDEEEETEALHRGDERERILAGLESFREDEACSRRDWMLEARGANRMLDRLAKWIAGGALPYEPKD